MSSPSREALLSADQAARALALDPGRSFIVQAPAGSGKTELLIQRLLSVLAQAEHPGEVLAITFTNKAAGEMRERLHSALLAAANDPEGRTLEREVERQRHRLALAVLSRDVERGWKLLDRPEALLIDTFDAFCARIAAKAPLQDVAANAALAPITDQPDAILREAAREALFDPDISDESALLLRLAANRVDDVIALLADLLSRRAQWLGEAVDTSDAAVQRLSSILALEIERRIASVCAACNSRHADEIRELAAYTSRVFELLGLRDVAERRSALASAWPIDGRHADLWGWHELADLLLTKDDSLRRPNGVNVKNGFPAAKTPDLDDIAVALRAEMKQRMVALLAEVEGDSRFVGALAATRMLPSPDALEDHATTLKATLIVLRQAAAHLSVLLRDRGVADFSAVVLAAGAALLESRDEVLAAFDARLAHVLVDEVQDTNPAQFELLAALTSDWSPGDGRTLFLVGDPMQSIYSFRDADVSLFLRAQRMGVGSVELTPVTLAANYRSQPAVIDWVNTELERVFADGDGGADGDRVIFAPAVAINASGPQAESAEVLEFADEDAEALAIAAAIEVRRREEPEASIAVLVRSRAHANAIIGELRRRALPFAAREFADWAQREIVRDLLSLTFAVTAAGDRLSLFAVLRSPWVGCTLATLSTLAHHLDGQGSGSTARAALADAGEDSWQTALDDDARARVAHAARAFDIATARAWLSPLAERIEATWLALGGDRLLDAAQREEAQSFFRWLDRVATGGLLPPRHELEQLLAAERQSFAANAEAQSTAGSVEILTIHKSKGLEWDHVFVPGVDRATRADSRSLVQWRFVDAPTARDPHARAVLIAALDTRKREAGSVYDFVASQRSIARRDEAKRLLYVAATRARRRLTLTRCAAHKAPPADSFAGLLGLAFDESMLTADADVDARLHLEASLRRAPLPAPIAAESVRRPAYAATVADAELAVPQQQLNARAQGVAGHLLFEGLALDFAGFVPRTALIERLLLSEGADAEFARTTAVRLADWFAAAADRASLRFLFAPDHAEAASELMLATARSEQLRVDRTFVTVTGERWLVDFKFSEPAIAVVEGGGREAWLAAEAATYADQMHRYASLLTAIDAAAGHKRALRVALYFPWLDVLHELPVSRGA